MSVDYSTAIVRGFVLTKNEVDTLHEAIYDFLTDDLEWLTPISEYDPSYWVFGVSEKHKHLLYDVTEICDDDCYDAEELEKACKIFYQFFPNRAGEKPKRLLCFLSY